MSTKGKRIQVTAPPELMELARIIGSTPAAILEQFAQDLLQLPRSSGSDERDQAGDYFLRTNMVNCDQFDDVLTFISISRAEYPVVDGGVQ
ncbi:hypothetical protein WDW37_13995 [Bdellovibrionota bacterium FG-1]